MSLYELIRRLSLGLFVKLIGIIFRSIMLSITTLMLVVYYADECVHTLYVFV